jgi:hypothetical protein
MSSPDYGQLAALASPAAQSVFGTPYALLAPYKQDMAANYALNQPYARPGPYNTRLDGTQEKAFRSWVAANRVPFNVNTPVTDYDMRGFWLAQQNGQNPQTGVNAFDHKLHFTDQFKTPFDRDFSRQSQYALPYAPQWRGDRYLVANTGQPIFDQVQQTEGSGWTAQQIAAMRNALPTPVASGQH